jgi:hypothetical protein
VIVIPNVALQTPLIALLLIVLLVIMELLSNTDILTRKNKIFLESIIVVLIIIFTFGIVQEILSVLS